MGAEGNTKLRILERAKGSLTGLGLTHLVTWLRGAEPDAFLCIRYNGRSLPSRMHVGTLRAVVLCT